MSGFLVRIGLGLVTFALVAGALVGAWWVGREIVMRLELPPPAAPTVVPYFILGTLSIISAGVILWVFWHIGNAIVESWEEARREGRR